MHTCDWCIYPYTLGLLHRYRGNHISCEVTLKDLIKSTSGKLQWNARKPKPCAYFCGWGHGGRGVWTSYPRGSTPPPLPNIYYLPLFLFPIFWGVLPLPNIQIFPLHHTPICPRPMPIFHQKPTYPHPPVPTVLPTFLGMHCIYHRGCGTVWACQKSVWNSSHWWIDYYHLSPLSCIL